MGIALDGGRYFTVVPQEDGISIERNFGWDISFAYYVRGTIRYILHEFYYDKSESSRYQYEDFINSILIFDSKDEKESFKLHVKEHWEEYC